MEEADQGALTRGKISRLRLTPATLPKLETKPSRESKQPNSLSKAVEKTPSSRRRRSSRLKSVSEGGKSDHPMDHDHPSEDPGKPEASSPESQELERPAEAASERDREKERNREREREQLRMLRERAAAVMGLEDLEGDGGMLPHNMASASNALNGLLRKLGAGIDDLLPPSSSISMQNSRFKQILNGLRADGEPGRQLESLNELCELLSIGTEDSLSSFSVEAFVPVLVTLLNCEHNPDMMLLAARALTHLCDVLPSSCAAVVHHGAVQCFCARLLTIEYIDLAEQVNYLASSCQLTQYQLLSSIMLMVGSCLFLSAVTAGVGESITRTSNGLLAQWRPDGCAVFPRILLDWSAGVGIARF